MWYKITCEFHMFFEIEWLIIEQYFLHNHTFEDHMLSMRLNEKIITSKWKPEFYNWTNRSVLVYRSPGNNFESLHEWLYFFSSIFFLFFLLFHLPCSSSFFPFIPFFTEKIHETGKKRKKKRLQNGIYTFLWIEKRGHFKNRKSEVYLVS